MTTGSRWSALKPPMPWTARCICPPEPPIACGHPAGHRTLRSNWKNPIRFNQASCADYRDGRGIGRATAIKLARRGYQIALVSRTSEELSETARLIGGGQICVTDVSECSKVARMVEMATAQFGRIDALVH